MEHHAILSVGDPSAGCGEEKHTSFHSQQDKAPGTQTTLVAVLRRVWFPTDACCVTETK